MHVLHTYKIMEPNDDFTILMHVVHIQAKYMNEKNMRL